jgi:hypothetical protein
MTQNFNTTHSMGRLTLNILLSFAQFEREIIDDLNGATHILVAVPHVLDILEVKFGIVDVKG